MTPRTLAPGTALFAGLYRGLARAEMICAVVALAGLAALLMLQVVSRYVFAAPLFWTEELGRLAMLWMTFIGAAIAAREGTHIALDVVVARIPARFSWIHLLIVRLFVLVYCGFLGVGTWELVKFQSRTTTPVLGMPSMVFSLPLLVFVVLVVMHTLIAMTGYHDDALDPALPFDDSVTGDDGRDASDPRPAAGQDER